jgi:hypothetical protein
MAEKLTPMMQQYFEVQKQVCSPLFGQLSADVFQRRNRFLLSGDVRQETRIYTHPGMTRRV